MATPTVRISLNIPLELGEALDAEARRSGRTKTEIVVAGLGYELGITKGAKTMKINVIAAHETHTEAIVALDAPLSGTEAQMIADAKRLVADAGYRVLDDADGGCCELTEYADGTAAIGITVSPSGR